MQLARLIFLGLAWIFVVLVVLQVFWAGMALFAGGGFGLHQEFGYYISGVPLLMLVAAFFARPGRGTLAIVGALFIVTFVQTSLPLLRNDLPFVAALHPPTALLIFWLALTTARRATATSRIRDAESTAATEAPVAPA